MSHDFRSARYLDDPFKPVLGLSIPQALALGVAIGVATVTWNMLGARLGDAAITSPLGELRLIVVGAPCAVMYGVVHMLTGGRTEQPLQQAWGYLHRRHRYEPRPLPALRPESLTTQEVHHDRAALPAPAARRRPAVHLPSIHLRVPRVRLALPGLRLPGFRAGGRATPVQAPAPATPVRSRQRRPAARRAVRGASAPSRLRRRRAHLARR